MNVKPENKKLLQLTIRVPKTLHEKLRARAYVNRVSINSILVGAINNIFQQPTQTPKTGGDDKKRRWKNENEKRPIS